MKFHPTPLLLCLLLSVFLAGCGGPSTVTVGLKTDLTKVVRQADGRALVTWRLLNPNIVAYLMARANHRIYLDGVLVGTAEDHEAIAIPAQTNQERTSVLTVAGAAGEQALAKAAAAGSATYRLESTIIIRLFGEETEKSELRATGTVPVSAK